jgi:hypothetical protein
VASLHALVPRGLEGPTILSSNWEAWNPCSLGQRAEGCAARLNPPPKNRSNNTRRSTRGLWTNIQLQSQIRVYRHGALNCTESCEHRNHENKIISSKGICVKSPCGHHTSDSDSYCKMFMIFSKSYENMLDIRRHVIDGGRARY